MGNCQAIDNATILIQHPSGRADKLYWPVTAKEVMKSNPGHYVALLLTTTTFCPPATAADKSAVNHNGKDTVRVTRIKLLRPTDTLILGQVYRLITNQEVMKGLSAKKYAEIKKNQNESTDTKERMKQRPNLDSELQPKNSEMDKNKQVQKRGKQQSTRTTKSATKLRPWQPSLNSISESIS